MMTIKKCLEWMVGIGLLMPWLGAAMAADTGFNFGVFPNLSARVMVETYQPLANDLGKSIKQSVNLTSAVDFVTFNQRTMDAEYDLVLTAPHLAWLAWREGGYKPLLTYVEPAKGFLIVRANSAYQKMTDLRGKTIAMPDPLAVVNIRMEKILEQAGLLLGRDLTRVEAGSHTNAATHVNQGQADAAVVGVLAFLRLPKDVRDNLRVIAETQAMTSHVFLVRPHTSAAREQAIKQAIEQFTQSEAGQNFLQKGGFGGVRSLKKNELNTMEDDAKVLKLRFLTQPGVDGTVQ